jgi:uncharacterized protein (TIGR01777 family)
MTTIAISGSSGLIGSALSRALTADGHTVKPLKRGRIDAAALAGADVVVNLAGEKIDQRWSSSVKREIRASRVNTTTLIAESIATLPQKPRVLLSGSAIGIYGDRGDETLDESSSLGDDFLASVCREWEAATKPASDAGVRVVHLRTGIVLAKEGGVLARLLTPFRAGVGGRLGSGNQWMSWIAIADHVRAMRFLMDAAVSGPVNLVAPNPVTNAELTTALANELHRPAVFPVPKFAMKLVFGEMADVAVMASQRVLPRRLPQAGFNFTMPELGNALAQILG